LSSYKALPSHDLSNFGTKVELLITYCLIITIKRIFNGIYKHINSEFEIVLWREIRQAREEEEKKVSDYVRK
jgi:hypothetical protein